MLGLPSCRCYPSTVSIDLSNEVHSPRYDPWILLQDELFDRILFFILNELNFSITESDFIFLLQLSKTK